MEFLSFAYTEQWHYPAEFHAYLKLRKTVFIDGLGWPLWSDGETEIDQYDNPHASYVIVTKNQRVVGGARLLPSSADWHGWTQMAKDTSRGQITTMPRHIVSEGYDFRGVWECSRLLIDQNTLRPSERSDILKGFIDRLTKKAAEGGAKAMLSISPPTLQSTLNRMGFCVEKAGEPFQDAYDGRRYCALQMTQIARRAKAA